MAPRASEPRMPRRRVLADRIRLALTVEQITKSVARDVAWILCPWLARFPTASGIWLSVLAAHDANGALLEALSPSKKQRPNVYAAVFAVDVLRTPAYLIRHLKAAGVGGVINLPSVSFMDGDAGGADVVPNCYPWRIVRKNRQPDFTAGAGASARAGFAP